MKLYELEPCSQEFAENNLFYCFSSEDHKDRNGILVTPEVERFPIKAGVFQKTIPRAGFAYSSFYFYSACPSCGAKYYTIVVDAVNNPFVSQAFVAEHFHQAVPRPKLSWPTQEHFFLHGDDNWPLRSVVIKRDTDAGRLSTVLAGPLSLRSPYYSANGHHFFDEFMTDEDVRDYAAWFVYSIVHAFYTGDDKSGGNPF
jgi:hypothetical protein